MNGIDKKPNSSWSHLPSPVIVEIFTFLNFKDLFTSCVIVCKRWNAILRSDYTWASLLAREFGKTRSQRFFQATNCSAESLREQLARNAVFRSNCMVHKVSSQQMLRIRRLEGFPTIWNTDITFPPQNGEQLSSSRLLRRFAKSMLLHGGDDGQHLQWRSAAFSYLSTDSRKLYLINLLNVVPLPPVFDILKIPLAFEEEVGTVLLFDSLMNELAEINSKLYKCWVIARNYPPGVRYVATEISPKFFRIVMPSYADKLAKMEYDFYDDYSLWPIGSSPASQ